MTVVFVEVALLPPVLDGLGAGAGARAGGGVGRLFFFLLAVLALAPALLRFVAPIVDNVV